MVVLRALAVWTVWLLCNLVMAAVPQPAWATVWTGGATVAIGGVDPGWLGVSIPGFDPHAGTIVDVSVSLNGSLQASVFAGPEAVWMVGASFANGVQFASQPTSIALASARAVSVGPFSLGETVPVSVTGALSPGYAQTARNGDLDVGLFFLTLLGPERGSALAQTIAFTGRVEAVVTFADETSASAAPASIPEPATAALIGAGLLAAGFWLRRR